MRERTPITKSLIESLPKLKYIMTSGMRNKAINLKEAEKKYNYLWYEINPNPLLKLPGL